jgi:hypothetical protein
MSDGKGFACAVQRVAMAAACAVGLSALSLAEIPDRVFLQRHCIDCHDRDGREAGLSLEDAVFSPNDPDKAGLPGANGVVEPEVRKREKARMASPA